MSPPPAVAPVLRLLPNSAAVVIPYGRPSPVPLAPCASLALRANGTCGAVAWDVPPAGQGNATAAAATAADGTNATDLSAGVVVRDVTPCEKGQVRGRGPAWPAAPSAPTLPAALPAAKAAQLGRRAAHASPQRA